MSEKKYTLVQHSGWTVSGNSEFRQAVEVRSVTAKQAERVVRAGGVLFDTWEAADRAEYAENYPPSVQGLVPVARGTFANTVVDGSAVYVPKREEQ